MLPFPFAIFSTFREHWPASVSQLAVPATSVDIPIDDVAAFAWHTPELRDLMPDLEPAAISEEFYRILKEALEGHPEGVFPRLGYCSWKGSDP